MTGRRRLYDPPMADADFLTLDQVAARIGWSVPTARTMHYRANRRRAADDSRPGDLPAPDHRFGRTPVWAPETIDAWISRRPGRGAGGGPKPRTTQPGA